MDEKKRKRINLSLSRKKSRTQKIEDSNGVSQNSSPNGKTNSPRENSRVGKSPRRQSPGVTSSSNAKPKISILHMLKNPPSANSVACPMCSSNVLLSDINQHLDSGCESHMLESGKIRKSGTEVQKTDTKCISNSNLCCGVENENIGNHKSGKACQTRTRNDRHGENVCETQTVTCSTVTCIVIDDEDRDSITKTQSKIGITNNCESPNNQNNTLGCNDLMNGVENGVVKNSFGFETCKQTKPDPCNGNNDLSRNDTVNNTVISGTSIAQDVDTSVMSTSSSNTETTQAQDPYYLSNFKLVLDTVMSYEEDKNLFNDADNEVSRKFSELSGDAQSLYVRLFQRKFGWFRCCKLDYPKISEDLSPILKELINVGFLQDERQLQDVKQVLKLLSAPDLKNLGKSFNVMPKSSSQRPQTKEHLIEALIKHGGTQRSLFGSSTSLLLKRARQALGSCVHVAREPRSVFARVLLLFSMNVLPDDEDNRSNGQTQQLSTIFLVNIGKLTYPSYTISRDIAIFPSRDHLISYAAAYQEKHEMFTALEVTGDLEAAYSYYPKATERYSEILSTLNQGLSTCKDRKLFHSSALPPHLQCFSAEWVHTRMCYLGVEVLQKMRRYQEAVDQLELLLKQRVYCADCRGRWWDRLALNLHQHLKQPDKALDAIKQALEDNNVQFGHRLALIQRAKKIFSSSSYKKKKNSAHCEIDDSLLVEPRSCNTVSITGKRSAELGVFISEEVSRSGEVIPDTVTYCIVEEYALSHYRKQGYDEGIHGETGIFLTLYGMLFWDIIFMDGIADVFRVPYQSSPLDFSSDSFYHQRKDLIDRRLIEIRDAQTEALQEMLERSWAEHEGQVCAGVNWDRFSGVDQAKQLAGCFGGKLLSGVFKHFAKNMRHRHSGMPDLVVWNSTTLDYRIVEVKGPGDRLSTKQQVWLGDLASLGATAEVCYVTAIGSKKLKVKADTPSIG